jgi:hypothetical protein
VRVPHMHAMQAVLWTTACGWWSRCLSSGGLFCVLQCSLARIEADFRWLKGILDADVLQ